MTRQLPEDVIAYKIFGPFKGENIPNMVLNRHNTKVGVWGKLEVLQGAVRYTLCDNGEAFDLKAGDTHIILPQEWHMLVIPEGVDKRDVEIQVTFHKVATE